MSTPIETAVTKAKAFGQLIADGKTSREIAHDFGLSFNTVNDYLCITFAELKVKNRANFVALGFREGWIK